MWFSMLYIMQGVKIQSKEKVGQEQCSYEHYIGDCAVNNNSLNREICKSLLALQSSCFPSSCCFYEVWRFIFPFSL